MTAKSCNQVLLIEDESEVREAARLTLELEGFCVEDYASADEALQDIEKNYPGIILSDVRMPGIDGLELLDRLQKLDADLPVLLVTGHGDIKMALQAVRAGAYDFIEKPVAPDHLLEVVKRALQTRQLVLENRKLKHELANLEGFENKIIGNSEAIARLRDMITNIAKTGVDILLHGETGTGKELVANTLHNCSRRSGKFVALNCGALPESVIESELFGHEAGAFTGASKRRTGKIEYANGGTLFLDELESMPMHLQVKMLRVLQERKLERLGGNESITIDVRVVAATKRDLLEAARQGEFREDLYYRLNVASINIPPLRERLEDVPLLFRCFASQSARRLEREEPAPEQSYYQQLLNHNWPGNVRELQNEAERYVLGISTLMNNLEIPSEASNLTLPEQLEAFEKHLLTEALKANQGRVSETAQQLAIPRKKLYLRLQKFNIEKENYLVKK